MSEVETRDVQLGEQPNHPLPPTLEELEAAKENNTAVVAGLWKELNSLMVVIRDKVEHGSDPATMELRNYIAVQVHHTGIKVSQGK